MKEEIYKLHDTVYHWRYGQGKVVEINYTHTFPIKVQFNENFITFTENGKEHVDEKYPSLSLRYYNLTKGGFSQERPFPDLKKGDIIYICEYGLWHIRIFAHLDINGRVCYFEDGRLNHATIRVTDKWSLNNPEEYNK